jgi:ribonuclease HI
VLISPQGDKLNYVLRMSFPNASNNKVDYESLLHGMRMTKAYGATRLRIFSNSNLMVQQVMNRCNALLSQRLYCSYSQGFQYVEHYDYFYTWYEQKEISKFLASIDTTTHTCFGH